MSEEKDFFQTCFNTVASLEVKNESQAIAKEVILSEIENLQQENKQLKMINKEYERLNKENGRGFKIINVQEYDIYELLSYKKYKDNWNKLKEHLKEEIAKGRSRENLWLMGCYDEDKLILDKMEELEQGSDSNE